MCNETIYINIMTTWNYDMLYFLTIKYELFLPVLPHAYFVLPI